MRRGNNGGGSNARLYSRQTDIANQVRYGVDALNRLVGEIAGVGLATLVLFAGQYHHQVLPPLADT